MDFLKDKQNQEPKESEPQYSRQYDNNMWDSAKSFIWETFKVIVISLAIIIPVRFFLIQPFYVQGASMEPNFFDNEYLIVDEISYRFDEPSRGDIIVFRYPRDPKQFFIKRVIGLPGDEVQIRDGEVRIISAEGVGIILEESSYLAAGTETGGSINVRLKDDEYYVLGDNRGSSLDSRSFGVLDREAVVGKVWLRGWPIDRITVFERPIYGN